MLNTTETRVERISEHNPSRACGRCVLAVMAGVSIFASMAGAGPYVSDTAHTDGRGTPRLVFPTAAGAPALRGRKAADAFLAARHDVFKVSPGLSELELLSVRESLVGTHCRYRQLLNGVPVDGADLVVSVKRDAGQVYQAYNNTYPVAAKPPFPKRLLGKGAALDAAWNHLRVHGRLLGPQRGDLVYVPDKGGFRLVYKTLLAVEAPFGYWEHRIDAVSGEVVSVQDTAVSGCKRPRRLPDFSAYAGPVWPRAKAAQEWEAASPRAALATPRISLSTVNGTAKVFDGDPRTYLANAALVDNSTASAFAAAYVTRVLRDITLSAGVYSLDGPWVRIVDFERPVAAPSTTTTGQWTSLRGKNAFNDVMTYYHIDQNQRYLQSLGYSGATGIQYGPIEADSNGVGGDDNSYYLPSENRLSFGHGDVDDNEDADVILHEYGHAITFDIVPSWGGGDTGAIGEGFGDYWGASYSCTTTNGTAFHPEWAFSWDGHSADTWTGRFLDKTNLTYDASHTYVDHETIGGIANYSDQLWGTPLFQAFWTLRGMGCPREDVDKIVIESFFGIGASPTMRDMANATVRAAMELFPAGPHAAVLYDKFAQQLILTVAPLPDPTLLYPVGGESLTTGSVALVQWSRNNAPPAAAARIEYTSQLSGGAASFFDQVEAGANGWAVARTGGTDWSITTNSYYSASHSWYAADDTAVANQTLTKSSLVVSNGAFLAFWHAYDLEGGFDGGVVEISTNGTTWIDLGTNAVQNGYNATIDTGYNSPIAGRKAFSGSSGGFVETVIPLAPYYGRTVSIRFREADDSSEAAAGWWVDDIRIASDPQWIFVATTLTNVSSYAWLLPGAVGTNTGVRVKLTGSNLTDSGWATSQAFVLKGIPRVTAWPTAGMIIEGQPLAASALSGGAATPAGTFAFATPSLVPGAGTAPQSVTFTPDDSARYNAASGMVSVTVAPLPSLGDFSVTRGTGAALRFSAVGGVQYRVRYADDLLVPPEAWSWITPPAEGWITAPTSGPLVVADPGATNSPQRFYRLEERIP